MGLSAQARAVQRDFGLWAIEHHPSEVVREAARRDYDVRMQVMADVVSRALQAIEVVSASVPEVLIEGEADFQGMRRENREGPRAEAMKLQWTVAQALGRVDRPKALRVQVQPVQRVTFWSGTDRQYHQTSVVVQLLAEGVGERAIVISCE